MPLNPDFIADLRKRFSGEIRVDVASRVLYSTDASIYEVEPLGVALPRTQDDLQAAVEAAAEHKVPILARGAGSSLAGQAIGAALILDCSRWLNRIVDLDPVQQLATVEPGVVLDALNRAAARHGLKFGPDPASADRATLGGVIANNASGAHSIVYGMAVDHLHSAEVYLSDGGLAVLQEMDPGDLSMGDVPEDGGNSVPRLAAIWRCVKDIRANQADAIRARFPRAWRSSAGYRLNYLLPWSPGQPPEWMGDRYPGNLPPGKINAAHLLGGSEGTLAVIGRATVNLVPKPPYNVLVLLEYQSTAAACDAIPAVLEYHPSAVELLPQLLLRLARSAPGLAQTIAWLTGDPGALLVVEFSDDTQQRALEKAKNLRAQARIMTSAQDQAQVWNLRRIALGILDSRPQSARPIAFIEDCAVPVESLGEFVRELERLLGEHGAAGGIYGHASAGCLHVKPILDLKSRAGRRSLRLIAEAVVALALKLGGSMTSEHGDGMARGEWLRQTYGDDLFDAMKKLKDAADPDDLLNPRRKVHAPPVDANLRRTAPMPPRLWKAELGFRRNGGLLAAIEQCNGQAACRSDTGSMCPSFQATREEMHSTRGRANLLRAFITTGRASVVSSTTAVAGAGGPATTGLLDPALSSEAVFGALDLCLSCKACKAECPSGVDMAKLKAEFLREFYRSHRRPVRDYFFGYFHLTAHMLSAAAPIVNPLGSLLPIRLAASRLLGITARRPFPQFVSRPPRPRPQPGSPEVLFLRDAFNHYVDSAVEQAAYDLLFSAGFHVRVLPAMGAGASLISKGFLVAARRHADRLIQNMVQMDPHGKLPLVCIEPPEVGALRHDYRDLLPDESEQMLRRASACLTVEEFLLDSGMIPKLRVASYRTKIELQHHCHQKAETQVERRTSSGEFLRQFGYTVEALDAGCCGMAGTFGYEAEHYELSQRIGELALFGRIRGREGIAIAATGAACRLQITQGTGRPVEHPLVYAARVTFPAPPAVA